MWAGFKIKITLRSRGWNLFKRFGVGAAEVFFKTRWWMNEVEREILVDKLNSFLFFFNLDAFAIWNRKKQRQNCLYLYVVVATLFE